VAELHHELPTRLDVDWYRKQAKRLLAGYRAGEADATARVDQVLGARARERFRLSDAQYLIAAEHGFRNWAVFVRAFETTPPARPVGRIGSVGGTGGHEERARQLVEGVNRGDADAIKRVLAYLPRLADASDEELAGSGLPLRDARIVVAREYGFPTWRELVHYVDKANREFSAEQEARGDLAAALEAIRNGEPERLRALLEANPAS
jgi:hypothetical protein